MTSIVDGLSPEITAPAAPPLPGLKARFVRGVRWNLVAAVAAQGSAYLVNIVLARILLRQAFGEYAIIQNTILTASMIAQVGTGLTANKYVAEFRSTDKERVGRIIGMCFLVSGITSLILALLMIAGAQPLARVMLASSELAPSLMLGAGILVFIGINGSQLGALAGLESYRPLAVAASISALVSVVLATIGAMTGSLNGALTGLLVASAVQWLITRLTLNRELAKQSIRLSIRNLGKEREILLRFAIPASLSGLTSMPALWLANTMLVHQTNGFSQMALYSAAATTKSLMMFLPGIVNSVGTSLLNHQRGAGAVERYRKVFWTNLAFAASFAIIGGLFLLVAAGPLLSLFGKSFAEGVPVLRILIIGASIEVVSAAVYQIIQAHERMLFSLLFIAIPRDVMIVIFAWYFTPLYGARGLALAYTLAWAASSMVYVTGAMRLGLHPAPARRA
jgi:O-antigen/teichoic acid export membrane protein